MTQIPDNEISGNDVPYGESSPKPISDIQRNREHSFGYLMQMIGRNIDVEMKGRLAEVGVDVKIFANLMVLLEQDGINQRELGDILNFPDYYTSRNIDTLVKLGFAERRPDPNSRRTILIFLTEEGRKKAMQLPKIIREANEHYLGNLDDDEKSQIIKLLHKVHGIKHYLGDEEL